MKTRYLSINLLFLLCWVIVPTSYANDDGITSEKNCNGIDVHPTAKVINIDSVDCYYESEASLQELVEFHDTYFITYRWDQSHIREYNIPKSVEARYTNKATQSEAFLTVTDKQPQQNIRTVKLRAGSFYDVSGKFLDELKAKYKK